MSKTMLHVCITEAEEFETFCLNKVVLQNVLVGLHDAKRDYLEEKMSVLRKEMQE